MADTKISQLGDAAALDGTELIPIVQGGANKKSTISSLSMFSKYPSAANFAALPTATGSNEIRLVLASSGVWLVNRKSAGFYQDTASGTWTYIGDYPVSHTSLTDIGTLTHDQLEAALLNLSSFVDLGVKSVDFSVTRVAGAMVTYTSITTGTAAVAMTLVNPDPVTEYSKQVVAIRQGATARVITLKGTDGNVISSGSLMSSGDALLNSGANTLDVFTFEWNGAMWETMDARYDVKA